MSTLGAICGYCGKSAGFTKSTEVFCDENDQDFAYDVKVCNHCGEFNSGLKSFFPRLAKRSEVTRCPRCGRVSVRRAK